MRKQNHAKRKMFQISHSRISQHLKWRGWSDYYMSLSIYFPLAYKMLRRIVSYIGNACMRIFASSIFTNGSIYNRMPWICQVIALVTRSSLLVFESIYKSLSSSYAAIWLSSLWCFLYHHHFDSSSFLRT